MAGRPRKPTALHVLQGTARWARSNEAEPLYPIAAPEKPPHILANPEAEAEWDRVLPMLLSQGVMSPVYRTAFEAYCVSYSDFVAAEQAKAASDRPLDRHLLAESRNARIELRQAASQLGITPATSGKVIASQGHGQKDGIRAFQARKHAIDGAATKTG